MLTGQLTTPERVVVIFIICSFCGTHVTAICGSTVIYSKDETKERSSPPCHQLHAHFSVPTLILVPSHVYSDALCFWCYARSTEVTYRD